MKNKISITLYMAACSLLLNACSKDQASITQDQIIRLTVADTAGLKADGKRVVTLTAHIDKDAADAYRNVTFNLSTGLGTFLSSASSTSSTVAADASGTAVISFKVGALPGSYFVSAQVGTGAQLAKTADIPIVLGALSYSDKLQLTPTAPAPAADGVSLVTFNITAKYVTEKSVKVKTNQGSFLNASAPQELAVALDDQGNGSFVLQVGNTVTPYTITAAFQDNTTAVVNFTPKVSLPDTLIAEPSAIKVDTVGTPVIIATRLLKNQVNAKVSVGTQASFFAYQLNGTTRVAVGRFTNTAAAISDASGAVPAVNFYGDTGGLNKNLPVYIEVSADRMTTGKVTQTIQLSIKQ